MTVTPETESAAINVSGDENYEVKYYAANDEGEKTGAALSAIKDPGTYVIEITAVGGDYVDGVASATLDVEVNDFTGVTFSVYEVNPAYSTDTGDDTIVYTGSDLSVGVAATGSLKEGEDYEVKFLKANSDGDDPAVAVHDAGNYVAYITGLGKYAGKTAQVSFPVYKFNFSDSEVSIIVDDVIDGDRPTHPTKVIFTHDGRTTELDPSLVSLELATGVWGTENDNYALNVTYTDENIIGGVDGVLSGKASVNKVGASATFKYDDKAVEGSYVVNVADGESFDFSKIKVYTDSDTPLSRGDYEVMVKHPSGYTETDTSQNALDSYDTMGTYEVSVRVKASSTGYEYGGTKTFTVKLTKGSLDADAQVYVKLDGKVVSSVEKNYDGAAIDLATNIDVEGVLEDGAPVAPADLVAKLYDADGKEVTEAKDAGTYTLKVTSDAYDLTGTTEMTIKINKLDFTQIKLGCLSEWSGSQFVPMERAVVMSGSTVVVSAIDKLTDWASYGLTFDTGFQAASPDAANDGKGWDSLETTPFWNDTYNGKLGRDYIVVERYDADKGEWVEVADKGDADKVEGSYRLTVSAVDSTMEKNYEFANAEDHSTTIEFKVVDKDNLKFTDVTPNDWFFNCVGVMAGNNDWGTYADGSGTYGLQLVRGYAGTNVFGPNNTITRADVAVILYRMAGGNYSGIEDSLVYDETEGWVTGFSDIDDAGLGNMYYAKAVAWANKAGVVNGYDDGTFGPYDEITREQLATMLANFSKNVERDDVALVQGELDAMPDGVSVSTWAQKAVSWCLENELMGNDGSIRPTDTITRAETAAMAYNYLTKVVGLK